MAGGFRLDIGVERSQPYLSHVDAIMADWDANREALRLYSVTSYIVVADAEWCEGHEIVPAWLLGGYVIAANKHVARCEVVNWTNYYAELPVGERVRITDRMRVAVAAEGVHLPAQMLSLRKPQFAELLRRIEEAKA